MDKESILIAEDDQVTVRILSGRLRALGFHVLVAFDAMQALMLAQRHQPAAVILDIQMPGGTGVEVLTRIKASAKTCQIPVLVVTGSIEAEREASVRQMGADEFFLKPVDFDELHRALCRLLGKPVPGSTPA